MSTDSIEKLLAETSLDIGSAAVPHIPAVVASSKPEKVAAPVDNDEPDPPDIYNNSLPFATAMTQTRLGRRVTRSCWFDTDTKYLFYLPAEKWRCHGIHLGGAERVCRPQGFLVRMDRNQTAGPYFPTQEDREATDWLVIDPDQNIYFRDDS